MTDECILSFKNITKKYPGAVALKDVSLDLKKGEILAIAGENGAGKSTLIKTCTGAVVPDAGRITIDGVSYGRMTPKLARQNGISVLYQEVNNVKELSVAENMFLGRPVRHGITVDMKAMEEATVKALTRLHIYIDPKTKIKNLSIGYQQMVEIAKALDENVKVLIMDEPSALLSEDEVSHMFEAVRMMRDSGVAIIYITHRLDEIFALSDRIAVLRDGEYITTLSTAQTDKDELIKIMVGREIKDIFPPRSKCRQEATVLEVRHLSGNGDTDINFEVKKGEILGIGGLGGSGRTELAEMIFGIAPIESGQLIFKGEQIRPKSPKDAINKGIGFLTEDRINKGNIPGRSVKENIMIPLYKKISRVSVVKSGKESEIAVRNVKKLSIKTQSEESPVRNLSGGNQQKVILARWLAAQSELLIFDEPTVGIDVGAKYEIYKLMNELVEKEGKSILMISSDMQELMSMSDRIVVLSEGHQTGILEKDEFNQEKIMKYATMISTGVSRKVN